MISAALIVNSSLLFIKSFVPSIGSINQKSLRFLLFLFAEFSSDTIGILGVNDDIVQNLNKKGSEGVSIHTKNNNIVEVIPEAKELGFVGIPTEINNDTILNILKQNKVPIVSPLGLDKNNQTYNVNGDTAAMAIAKSLKARRLLLMTNVDGVLNKEKKLIEEISSKEILEMIKNETITEGMIPKINACLDAVNNGVTGVGIINGTKKHSCLWEIFTDKGAGTLIRK